MGGMLEGVGEDLGFDLGGHPVGVRPAGAPALFEEGGDAAGLEGAADLVERVNCRNACFRSQRAIDG
jgi:hypothetical protein